MSLVRQHWQYLTSAGAYPGVDLLRALAVCFVVLYHSFVMPIGWVGVDIFFVLSGFLIGGAILDKGMAHRFSFSSFYGHRALRILPVYYFMIFMCVVTKARELPLDAIAWKSILAGMLFLQTTGTFFAPGLVQVDSRFIPDGSWSLVIEEMFYLVAPLLLICLINIYRNRLVPVFWWLLAIAFSGVATRLWMTSAYAPDDSNWYFASFIQFHSRYDELVWGVLAAVVVRVWPQIRKFSWAFVVLGGVGFASFAMFVYSNDAYWLRPYLMTGATIWAPTVLGASFCAVLLGWFWRASGGVGVVILARLSYPLYLVHLLFLGQVWGYREVGVLKLLHSYGGEILRLGAMYVATLMLSYLVSLCVEFPFIRLYKRIGSSTPQVVSSAA